MLCPQQPPLEHLHFPTCEKSYTHSLQDTKGSPEQGASCQPKVSEQTFNIMNATEPAFLNITVYRIHTEVLIKSKDALEAVVRCIFKMIVNDVVDDLGDYCSKHARCGETYADIMFILRTVAPTFPMDDDKPMTFTRVLLNVTQDTFEDLTAKFQTAEMANELSDTAVNGLIALVSFIGHLYVRRLVAARVMAQVMHDLVGVRDRHPEKELVRCACELVQIIGKAMDAHKQGSTLMTQFLARFNSLAAMRSCETEEALYPQDIRDAIRACHEARSRQWPARAGTQVLVQFHIVTLQEAAQIWHELKEERKLPVDQMLLSEPRGIEEVGHHLKITSVISSRNMAVLFSKQVEFYENESAFKDEISSLTGIHAKRLLVFKPDCTLWEA